MIVLNKHRDTIPAGAVYIGRPSLWGNPFVIGRDGDRAEVIRRYRQRLATLLLVPLWVDELRKLSTAPALVCFCAPEPCHGDVLVEAMKRMGMLRNGS